MTRCAGHPIGARRRPHHAGPVDAQRAVAGAGHQPRQPPLKPDKPACNRNDSIMSFQFKMDFCLRSGYVVAARQ